jgi:hypothetical protein
MDENCGRKAQEYRTNQIFFDFMPFSFFSTRAASTDDPRDLFISPSPCRIRNERCNRSGYHSPLDD